MADVKADAHGGFRRIEVLTGPMRRRRWSAEDKGQIVAETLVAGASVSDVARRRQVCPQQVFTWRRAVREGQLVLPMETVPTAGEHFVPIVMETPPASGDAECSNPIPERTNKPASALSIKIRLAEATMPRVAVGTDSALLTEVLRAIRAVGGVIAILPGVRVRLGARPVDFRKGPDGLAALGHNLPILSGEPSEPLFSTAMDFAEASQRMRDRKALTNEADE